MAIVKFKVHIKTVDKTSTKITQPNKENIQTYTDTKKQIKNIFTSKWDTIWKKRELKI